MNNKIEYTQVKRLMKNNYLLVVQRLGNACSC